MRSNCTFVRAGIAALFPICLAHQAPAADSVAVFYRGKTVTIYVGYPPGGQYDSYARLLARFLPRHLQGHPNVIVQNQPGGAGLTAASNVTKVAPQDGTAIAATSAAIPFQPLLDANSTTFDIGKVNWLPVPSGETDLVSVWHSVPLKSFLDARDRQTILGASGVTSAAAFYARIFNDVFKTKFKTVLGYGGAPDIFLAMERGEVEGHASAPWGTIKHSYGRWLQEGKLAILLQYGEKPNPELPNVPFARDLAQSEEDKLLLDVSMAPTSLARPYLVGPGVPPDRVSALRKAILAAWNDPMLVARATEERLDIAPLPGEEVQAIVDKTYKAPQRIIDRLRRIYSAEKK